MKREFYPHVKKDDLFKDGYIASPSSHSRGSTVDLTLVPLPQSNLETYALGDPLTACDEQASSRFRDGSLDMGTGYDCFDPRAHLMASGLTGQQRANRMLLAALMAQVGFAGYANEWWHFTLRNEPYRILTSTSQYDRRAREGERRPRQSRLRGAERRSIRSAADAL